MFQAVMLDMDGLIIDSEPLAKAAWQQTVSRFGCELEETRFDQMLGCRQIECARKICEWFSLSITPEALADTRNREFMRMLPGKVRPMPGFLDLARWLADRKITRALVTSGLPEYVAVVLQELNLENYFSAAITAEDVPQGKPAPDGYQLAARTLRAAPVTCLALEDAPNGIAAAKDAGLSCWAVPNRETRGLDLSRADLILPSLEEVQARLARL